jgi:hypothetical protein
VGRRGSTGEDRPGFCCELGVGSNPTHRSSAAHTLQHTIKRRRANVFDDVYDTSTRNRLRNGMASGISATRSMVFTMGVTEAKIIEGAAVIGIERWARRSGIAARGVLLDFQQIRRRARHCLCSGSRYGITAKQLQATADWEGTAIFRPGTYSFSAPAGSNGITGLNQAEKNAQLAQRAALQARPVW